ncbi:tetratricopeptide repeat protein [Sorangium sp. So ce131]|uniref:tetratricopeptide repeat protein n=1 Tax=Sorangium sp. So ce131 TaxID=3133282 RepID=UPI003F5E4876
MNTARYALSVACFSSALAAAGAASAEPDPAQAAFDRGVAHMEAGRFEQGCPEIAQSHALDPRPGTLFTLAECEALRGRLATAIARFDEYLALYPTLTPQQRRSQGDRERSARAQRAALARDVPELKLALSPGAPADVVVERDGQVLPREAIGASVPVDPGEHAIKAQAPGGPALELLVRVDKREKKTVTLEVMPPLPRQRPPEVPPPEKPAVEEKRGAGGAAAMAPPAAKAPDTGAGGRRAAVYVAGGLGLVGLAVGGVTGALAIQKKGVVDERCAGTACDADGMAAADAMKSLGLASTIGFAVGIAGAGAAAVLLLTEPEPASTGASGGAWVAAGVAPFGPGGAALEVRGAW